MIEITQAGDYKTRDGRRVTVHAINPKAVTFRVQGAIWKMFRGKVRPRGYTIWTTGGRHDVLRPKPCDIVAVWTD